MMPEYFVISLMMINEIFDADSDSQAERKLEVKYGSRKQTYKLCKVIKVKSEVK